MKYLSEYRDAQLVEHLLQQIAQTVTQPRTIMEICGGQTHGLVKNGIIDLLPPQITMVHGPGCPVCVTPASLIDDAIELAENRQVILCSFGDMLRVPGSGKSLLEAKAGGADVRMVYSPLDALQIAQQNPNREVVFFAVGFETTAPANALSVIQASRLKVSNYSILASQVLVPPAMEAILSDPQQHINAFLAAGHVCTIMGLDEYEPIARKYHVPIVVTGFEPVDLLQGILMAVKQLEKGTANVENQYARVVYAHGNAAARKVIDTVFEVSEREWRGIGAIDDSWYEVRKEFAAYNARVKFGLQYKKAPEQNECIAGAVLKGLKKPRECPNFGTRCRPENPMGAPMVSSEGACAAYYHYAAGILLVQHDKV